MTHVAIIGAGIGGLAAAVALRSRGLDVEVFEAAPEPRVVGAGIWMPTNAMRVLGRLGLAGDVLARSVALERIEIRDVRSGVITAVDLDDVRARFGYPTVSLHRAALSEALSAPLPDGCVSYGKACVDVEQEGNTAVAHFADGTTARADLLVGADGAGSVVRDALFPDAEMRDARQPAYRGVVDFELPRELQRTCWEVWGGAVRVGFASIAPGSVYWFAPISASAETNVLGPGAAAALAKCVTDFPDPIPSIIERTRDDDIIRTELRDIRPLRRWSRGAITLLGDAAHPMTPNLGQGGAQAVEDAEVLADALATHAKVSEVLQDYERRRVPRVRRIVDMAWRFGQLAHAEAPWKRRVRNGLLRALPDAMSRRQMRWMYDV